MSGAKCSETELSFVVPSMPRHLAKTTANSLSAFISWHSLQVRDSRAGRQLPDIIAAKKVSSSSFDHSHSHERHKCLIVGRLHKKSYSALKSRLMRSTV